MNLKSKFNNVKTKFQSTDNIFNLLQLIIQIMKHVEKKRFWEKRININELNII